MADELYNDSLGRLTSRTRKSAEDVASAQDTERLGSTAGANLGALQKGGASKSTTRTPRPVQEQGESLGAFSTRMRKWRDGEESSEAQRRALQNK